MTHATPVPYPVWCKWCRVTTEKSTMISGDWASVTLNHDTCGRILAEMPLRELSRLPSLQRSQVARFLVDRANRERPTLPTLDAADVQEDAQEAFRVASFGREER